MLFWSIINLTENLVTLATLYFVYVFLEKKDVSMRVKAMFSSLFLPYILLTPTVLNMEGFDVPSCGAIQGPLIKYFYFLEILFLTLILGYLVRKIVTAGKGRRKQVVYFAVGAVFFAASFSGANIVASLIALIDINADSWKILQYGLFGMPVFTGFLAYLIVRYEAFSIKLLAVQALVIALIALIASQFFFIQNDINRILAAVTLVSAIIFGWFLINSVKREVERKDELQQISDSLAKANAKLKELDNTKTEFISIASHQLRTPLTAIKGYLSLVLEGSYGGVSPEVGDVLEKVNLVNRHLIQLVEDLLNVSRIDTGRIRYAYEEAKVEPLVKDQVDMFMPAAHEKGIVLSTRLPDVPLPNLMIDAGKIREAVSNLVDNAIKYTDRGGSVTVSIESAEEAVRIAVTDTGIGFREEDGEKLFGKFVRTKETAKVNVSGTGLGLFVGKSFVEAHGGRMWAESEGIGKGAKFVIELPLRNPRALAADGNVADATM